MNHFLPDHPSISKRLAFLRNVPGTSGAGGSAERIETQLPSAGSPEEMRLRLAALEGQVSEQESRRSLESLRIGMELQQEDQRQEEQEVNYLLSLAQRERGLDDASQREIFLRSVQERMTLALAVLVADGEITEGQLAPANLAATLQGLEQNKSTLRVRSASGERNLYNHEQNLLRMPGFLSNHANEEVRRGWEQMAQAMRNNVRLMRAASNLVSGQSPDQSLTGRVSRGVSEAWDSVVQGWNNVPQTWKNVALITAAVGAGVYLLNRIFRATESGGRGSSVMRLLGVGALIAGGVYLYGRFTQVDEAWNRLRGSFQGLTRENFMEGLRHLRIGNIERARLAWGVHSDELIRQLSGGQPENQPTASETRPEVDEHGIEYLPIPAALRNYKNDLELTLSPVTSFISRHGLVLGAGALLTAGATLRPLLAGLRMTKDCLVGFARFFSSQVRHHPIISTMLIVAFAMKANGGVPKDGANLRRYINVKRQEFADFLRAEGHDPRVAEQHLDLAADIVDGRKHFSDLEEPASQLVNAALAGLSETMRLSQREKVRNENQNGLGAFIGDISLTVGENNQRRAFAERVMALREKMSATFSIPVEDLRELITAARAVNIRIEVENGYIWWGEADNSGNYLMPNDRRCIGIDPGLNGGRTLEQQFESASRFTYNPNASGELLMTAAKVPFEDLGEGAAQILERVLQGEWYLVIWDGVCKAVHGAGDKYVDIPFELARQIINLIRPDREVSAKDMIFTYAEGIMPVTVLGIATSLATFTNPFSRGRFGIPAIVSETATYPIRSIRDIGKRGLIPFRDGLRASTNTGLRRIYDGIVEVARYNGRRITDSFGMLSDGVKYRYWRWINTEKANSLIKSRELRAILAELQRADDALTEGGRLVHFQRARQLLSTSSVESAQEIGKGLTHLQVDEFMNQVRAAIQTQQDIVRGVISQTQGLVETTLRGIKSGADISAGQLTHLREVARDAEFADEFRDALKAAGIADDQLDALRDALRAEQSLGELSTVFRRAGLISEAAEGIRIAEEGAETASRARRALDFTLDTLRQGREIGKEILSYIWMSLRSEQATARYRSVWNALSSMPGATVERVSQFADACRNSQRLGQLREAVGRLNLFRLSPAVAAADAAEELATIARLSNVDIGSIFRSLRAGEAVDAIRMAQLDETLRTTEGLQEARRALGELGVAGDNADDIIRSVTTATSEAEFLQRLRQGGLITEIAETVRPATTVVETAESAARTLRHLDSALEAIRRGEGVGFRQLNALREAAKASDFADRLRAAGVASDKIDEVVRLLRSEAELARLKTGLEATGALRLSRGVSGMINVARIGGPLLAGAGVVAGGAEAWQSFAMAREVQNNDELREIYYARGGVNIAATLGNLAIDVGAIAGSRIAAATAGRAVLGVAGRGLAYVGGAAALPLTVIFETSRYMISGALEAQAEIARTNEDWLREASQKGYEAAGVTLRRDANGEIIPPSAVEQQRINDEIRNVLIHDWYTTGEDTGAGEAYSSVFTTHTIENYMDERVNTRLKLVEAIIKLETGNRSTSYNGYRVRYIESKTSRFNVKDFMKAEKVLEESRIFADIMENRDQVFTRTYEDGTQETINLRDTKYDLENIQIADVIAVSSAAKQQNNNEIKQLLGDALFNRITNRETGLDKNYLNYAISVMMSYICEVQDEHPDRELSEADIKIQRTAEALRKYLEFEGYRFTPNMSLSDPRTHMEDVNKVIFDESISAEEVTERMGFTPRSKGVAGLYVYASALGYKGSPNIGGLQSFFTEAKKDRFGIYWRPDTSLPGNGEWVVNEEGMESDNEAGSNPDVAVLEMIRIIREEPDNILTSRFDYITDLTSRDDQKKRADMMLELAWRMEQAYNSASAPANTQEYQGSTSTVSNLLSVDTWRESLGETAETITTGVTTVVTTTRDAIGSVLSSAGSGISSIASSIGSIFTSKPRE